MDFTEKSVCDGFHRKFYNVSKKVSAMDFAENSTMFRKKCLRWISPKILQCFVKSICDGFHRKKVFAMEFCNRFREFSESIPNDSPGERVARWGTLPFPRWNYIYHRFTLFGEPSDYLMNIMQLRCDKVYSLHGSTRQL